MRVARHDDDDEEDEESEGDGDDDGVEEVVRRLQVLGCVDANDGESCSRFNALPRGDQYFWTDRDRRIFGDNLMSSNEDW